MLTCEIHYAQKNKLGESVCGDTVKVKRGTDRTVVSISDGLGSGVKASILSTLTASIATRMVFEGMPISEVFESVISTLPTCKVRGISYATLATCLVNHASRTCTIYEYDAPLIFVYRNGEFLQLERLLREIRGRKVFEMSFPVSEGDVIFLMTDGISQAGMGTPKFPFGFGEENIRRELRNLLLNHVDLPSIVNHLVRLASILDQHTRGDDATVCAVKVREQRVLTVLVGPPERKENDRIVVERLFSTPGRRVICGGTTSQIVERLTGKRVEVDFSTISEISPPIGRMEGVDLVTEGIITLTQVFRFYEGQTKELGTGAQRLVDMLEEADIINFLVGRAINPAHQNPLFMHDISLKFRLIHDIAKSLQERGKIVNVEYF